MWFIQPIDRCRHVVVKNPVIAFAKGQSGQVGETAVGHNNGSAPFDSTLLIQFALRERDINVGTARGNERKDIFRDDRDRFQFLSLLKEMISMFGLKLHSYVMMDNHYHLLVELGEANLSRAVQWLNISYSVWHNRRHGRTGHFFQGRFKAIAIDPGTWALGMSVYIHLNPVRVKALGLGKRDQRSKRAVGTAEVDRGRIKERIALLRRYKWSSFRAYIALVKEPEWLTTGEILSRGPKQAGRSWYRKDVEQQVREGLSEIPWEQVVGQAALGGTDFIKEFRSSLKKASNRRELPGKSEWGSQRKLERIIAAVEQVKGEKWEEFRDRYGDWGRDMVILFARKRCGMKLRELGEKIGGMDYAAVSYAGKSMGIKATKTRSIREAREKVEKLLDFES